MIFLLLSMVVAQAASQSGSLQTVGTFLARQPVNFKRCYQWSTTDGSSVKTMAAKVFRDDSTPGYPTFGIELKTELKSSKRSFSTFFLCSEGEECSVECDGGQIQARASEGILEIRSEGFVLSGSCDGSNTVKFPNSEREPIRLESASCN